MEIEPRYRCLYDDTSQIIPLTPAMFLQENEETGVLDLGQFEKIDQRKRFRYRQKVREDMRHRFRAEYLGQLSGKRSVRK